MRWTFETVLDKADAPYPVRVVIIQSIEGLNRTKRWQNLSCLSAWQWGWDVHSLLLWVAGTQASGPKAGIYTISCLVLWLSNCLTLGLQPANGKKWGFSTSVTAWANQNLIINVILDVYSVAASITMTLKLFYICRLSPARKVTFTSGLCCS